MLLKDFEYVRVNTIEDALRELKQRENAQVIAGGQSLIQLLKSRIYQPGCLVDLNFVPELKEVSLDEDGLLKIGAMVTHNEVIENDLIRKNVPILAKTAENIGDLQIRNRGTIGGSICEADPSADYYPTLLVLDAEVVLRSSTDTRIIKIEDFYEGPLETAIEEGEILVQVIVPAIKGDFAAEKYARRKADFAVASVAAIVEKDAEGKFTNVRIATGAQEDYPKRLRNIENGIIGKKYNEIKLNSLIDETVKELEPLEDLHGSQEYRRYVLSGMLRRIIGKLLSDGEKVS